MVTSFGRKEDKNQSKDKIERQYVFITGLYH